MNVSGVNFRGSYGTKKTERNDFLSSVGASMAGTGAQTAVGASGLGVLAAMNKIGKVPNDKVEFLHKAAEKALDITGLTEKGVKLEYLKNEGAKKPIWQMLTTSPFEQVKQGYNAAFLPGKKLFGKFFGNKIIMPEKDMAFAAFHEIGHAINYNKSTFWKAMQNFRLPAMAIASIPMLYGAFSTQSVASDGKELTKKQKANNFMRDNAGKLSFAAMIPVLAEEGMASIRGQKLANKLLDTKMAKHVLKGNAVAYTSYILAAASIAVGSYVAVKVKDHLMAKKAEKAQKSELDQMIQASIQANPDVIV